MVIRETTTPTVHNSFSLVESIVKGRIKILLI